MKNIQKLAIAAMMAGAILGTNDARAQDKLTVEQAFITSDTDRSGSVTPNEFAAFLEKGEGKTAEQSAQDFSKLDANNDGKLTLEELEPSKGMFSHTIQ